MSNPAIEAYGWSAVPRNFSTLLSGSQTASASATPIPVDAIKLPITGLTHSVHGYAKKELPIETYNHSMRVYYYGQAILSQAFSSWSTPTFDETYFLSCLLHDIGIADHNITATLMSFEFHGALLAFDLLKYLSAPIAQAESVFETIARHQDVGETGKLTRVGALIQLATLFDNMGGQPQLVHPETIESVVAAYPRLKWNECFAKTIRKENALKPWGHTTHLGENDFPEGVESNDLMSPYEG